MKTEEQRTEERRIRIEMEHMFGDCLKDMDFCYFRRGKNPKKMLIVTYEDYKPEVLLQDEAQQTVGDDWDVVLKRTYSEYAIANLFMQAYRENKISICYQNGNGIVCDPIRAYVIRTLACG